MNHVEYMRKIGSAGGAKRKLNPNRFDLATRAAKASWTEEARAKRLSSKKRAKQTSYAKTYKVLPENNSCKAAEHIV